MDFQEPPPLTSALYVSESVRPIWRLRCGKTVIGTTLSLAGGVAHPFMHLWALVAAGVGPPPPIDRSLRPAAAGPLSIRTKVIRTATETDVSVGHSGPMIYVTRQTLNLTQMLPRV